MFSCLDFTTAVFINKFNSDEKQVKSYLVHF